ncbi:hypothetical protein TVAG_372320 [Trichomonas vaginalis G3]|uniref:Surface antigen BspA-like n=1 Tax=Trichomonas vaginalis (strain ATCC PRA-98 / G3) TaxID=412133 RepID=A2FZZ8_TRIV3|nr:ribonuclease inhibitor domain-containing protein [Trichomonas vaginalis G3]EAX89520.1 hypothetical protein TVAG_372320 [Trichomonas vaginalis G3]KAI5493351.1 ribonuclease inhibitor domain-containing protein [Trichomonas vaginalis G3]|eukprot:XP_001302450.1 hypothetical protein [Trichomonas vaginalis G3]
MFKSIFWNSLIFKPIHLNTENEEIRTLTITQTNGFSQETVDKIINQNYNKILINSHDVSLREFEGFNYISEFEISESSSNNIPKNLFSGNSKIKKVILPPQITQIDQFAFAYSTLQEINLENVLIIKENAFDSCLQLTTINLDLMDVPN